MNVPDLRNVDFDAYRQRALEMRQEAINEFIDGSIATVKAILQPHWRAAILPARTGHSPALTA